jgi:hypothetical protein
MYTELYKNIIDNARQENRMKNQGIYYERHHIVPDFLFKNRKRTGPKGHLDGDPDGPENIVLLTFSEHLLAHYYLYEIYKDTRYAYSAGSALQFFFVKATGNHKRQLQLSEIDKKFLEEMSTLRLIGNSSISKARKGKMPAVDAITRGKIGSVPVDHPNVISGKWIHHSKGVPAKKCIHRKSGKGENNPNYKALTSDRRKRLWQCVVNSCQDGYLKLRLLKINMEHEFSEFKKISTKWIENNYGTVDKLVDETNENLNLNIQWSSYHRSTQQRLRASAHSSKHRWYNNGVKNIRVTNEEEFCKNNPDYVLGRLKV